MLKAALDFLTQVEPESGAIHTPPEMRLMLYALAVSLNAECILELGFDAGYTTLALAESGAVVIGVDDSSEYPEVKASAAKLLAAYPNVALVNTDAVAFLRGSNDEFYDLIFVDDDHRAEHVAQEAWLIRAKLRQGGIAAFHDTNIHSLWKVVEMIFSDWEKINLPAWTPQEDRLDQRHNYGLALVRKPIVKLVPREVLDG